MSPPKRTTPDASKEAPEPSTFPVSEATQGTTARAVGEVMTPQDELWNLAESFKVGFDALIKAMHDTKHLPTNVEPGSVAEIPKSAAVSLLNKPKYLADLLKTVGGVK